MRYLLTTLLVFSLFSTACSDATEPVETDGEYDTFLVDGKSDRYGITEGSLEAQGVLRVVNTLSFADLNSFLDVRAARNVIAYRSGPDGVLGTGDDRVINTLVQLDSISWFGPASFSRTYNYALENDLMPKEGVLVHGILEGSGAAVGMLFVVNTHTFDELNAFLDVRAVRGIMAHRENGVSQNEVNFFQSLTELDAIPYMGATAFGRLLGYAQDNDYIFSDSPAQQAAN